jgi:hypothetical protein
VTAISAQNFLGRLYQTGFYSLSDLQIACLIRVIGKPDLDDAIVYKDLEMLLENFGVVREGDASQTQTQFQDLNTSELTITEDLRSNPRSFKGKHVIYEAEDKRTLFQQNRAASLQDHQMVSHKQMSNLLNAKLGRDTQNSSHSLVS